MNQALHMASLEKSALAPKSLPVISVVTPSFHQADYLESAIVSVLNQGYPRLDYAVIDGGSTDGSADIIQKYEPQLAVAISTRDRGHAHALNKGFSRSKGEVLSWVNSDDQLAPSSLWIVAELFTLFPEVEWLTGLPTVWDLVGRPVQTAVRRRNRFDHLRGRFGIQQESCFWRRSLWEKAGGYIDEDCGMMIDSELWSRFFQHADLWHVDTVLAGYRWHGQNRAVLNPAEALSETSRAFQHLRTLCSRAEEKLLKNISVYEQQCNSRSVWRRIIARVKARELQKQLQDYAYRVIRWERGSWRLLKEPYKL